MKATGLPCQSALPTLNRFASVILYAMPKSLPWVALLALTGACSDRVPPETHHGDDTGEPEVEDCPVPEATETAAGTAFTLRTPAVPAHEAPWPLMVVHSPRGGNPALTEEWSGLTEPALEAGFWVVYVDDVFEPTLDPDLFLEQMTDLASVPERVAETGCVDPDRIYLTGHSMGAHHAMVLAMVDAGWPRPAAVAVSGVPLGSEILAAFPCPPEPTPMFLVHHKNDEQFPTEGLEAAEFWGSCLGCDSVANPATDSCLESVGCEAELSVCELPIGHTEWSGLHAEIVAFFERH